MIRFEAVTKRYLDGDVERTVLAELSFQVPAGSTIAILGPSGSGKTTILNLVAGLVVADGGRVTIECGGVGYVPAEMHERDRTRMRRELIGYIFQFFNLIPTLTVAENTRLPLELTGRESLAEEAVARLADLGLAERLGSFPEVLSGGEQQRVAIARALAHRPAIILADEPTGNLDAEHADRVVQLLFEQVRASGATLLLATHSGAIAERADHRLTLRP